MPTIPKISSVIQNKNQGKIAIILQGKIISFGKDTIEAVRNAKKVVPNIEKQDFVISRIHNKYIAV